MMTHVHHSRYSVDCDGPISQESVANYAGADEETMYYLTLGFAVSDGSTVETRLDDDGHWHAVVWTKTEEGYRTDEIWECEYPECVNRRSYRDYRAEEAGY
jgi:hypothetical protein